MRFLPVIMVAAMAMLVAIKPPDPSWGVPLLGLLVVLIVLSFKAWIPKHHH